MAAPTSPPRQPPPQQQHRQPQQQPQQPQSGPEAIKRTMEYYFSDKNLVRDRFMHTKMAEDTTGEKWVRLDVLLTFPKLRKLVHEECKSEDQVRHELQASHQHHHSHNDSFHASTAPVSPRSHPPTHPPTHPPARPPTGRGHRYSGGHAGGLHPAPDPRR